MNAPGWHDGLLGGIVRLNLAVTQVLEAITGTHGIALPDYLVLGVVRGSPDQRSAPTAIADVLGRTTGGMSLTLDRLVNAGWVERSPDPQDRRRGVVALTPAGAGLATRVNAALHDWESSLDLGSDPAAVLLALDQLTGAVRARGTAPAIPA